MCRPVKIRNAYQLAAPSASDSARTQGARLFVMYPTVRHHHEPEERRSGHRFPIELELTYFLLDGKNTGYAGQGRTVNISSSGVLFRSPHSLRPGTQIELSIDWPARIDRTVRMQLRAFGRAVRREGAITGVQILHSEFRTARTCQPGTGEDETWKRAIDTEKRLLLGNGSTLGRTTVSRLEIDHEVSVPSTTKRHLAE